MQKQLQLLIMIQKMFNYLNRIHTYPHIYYLYFVSNYSRHAERYQYVQSKSKVVRGLQVLASRVKVSTSPCGMMGACRQPLLKWHAHWMFSI
jgi:hypothetical protein